MHQKLFLIEPSDADREAFVVAIKSDGIVHEWHVFQESSPRIWFASGTTVGSLASAKSDAKAAWKETMTRWSNPRMNAVYENPMSYPHNYGQPYVVGQYIAGRTITKVERWSGGRTAVFLSGNLAGHRHLDIPQTEPGVILFIGGQGFVNTPHENPRLDAAHRDRLPASTFALPAQRKYPLNNAAHVRNAAARLEQAHHAGYVSSADYHTARRHIAAAARRFGIHSEYNENPITTRQVLLGVAVVGAIGALAYAASAAMTHTKTWVKTDLNTMLTVPGTYRFEIQVQAPGIVTTQQITSLGIGTGAAVAIQFISIVNSDGSIASSSGTVAPADWPEHVDTTIPMVRAQIMTTTPIGTAAWAQSSFAAGTLVNVWVLQ